VSQQIDVPIDGHDLHLRAGLGDELRQPQMAEVAILKGVIGAYAQEAMIVSRRNRCALGRSETRSGLRARVSRRAG
jgi:hypothetical protein